MPDLASTSILCIAALLAGFVDAVAGGGGLIQVPALLFFAPNLTAATVLGTNKLSSIVGTSVALWRYRAARLVKVQSWRYGMVASAVGGAAGAALASALSNAWMRPLVLVLTALVVLYVLFGSQWTQKTRNDVASDALLSPRNQVASGAVAGIYDGFYGPGTGSFLVAALVRYANFDALKATAAAKTLNLASNLGALIWFVAHGEVSVPLGISLAACNAIGGLIGSHSANKLGPGFVRVVLATVVFALLCLLSIQLISRW